MIGHKANNTEVTRLFAQVRQVGQVQGHTGAWQLESKDTNDSDISGPVVARDKA